MRRFSYLILLFSIIISLVSCSTPTNVAYFQNAAAICGMTLQSEQPFRLRPKDKIDIVVNSSDPMLVQQFNLTSVTRNMNALGTTLAPQTSVGGSSSSSSILAYTVDEQGDITFPV